MGYGLPESLAFFTTVIFLSLISYFDFKKREVDNNIMAACAIACIILTGVSGHYLEYLWQHIITLSVTSVHAMILFRLGVIGGADFKALLIMSSISPGLEFYDFSTPLFESLIAIPLQMLVMFILGKIWYNWHSEEESEEKRIPPLLPFLLAAYLTVQIIPLFLLA